MLGGDYEKEDIDCFAADQRGLGGHLSGHEILNAGHAVFSGYLECFPDFFDISFSDQTVGSLALHIAGTGAVINGHFDPFNKVSSPAV